jgi:cytochrome c oxidase assembly protein Cox11
MGKLTYHNVVEGIKVIHLGDGFFEYQLDDVIVGTKIKQDFSPKKNRPEAKDANKKLVLWKKGLRMLIRIGNEGPRAFEVLGNAVHHNGPKNNTEYFWRLYKTVSTEDIIKMGETGNTPVFTSYVDGSYDYTLEN